MRIGTSSANSFLLAQNNLNTAMTRLSESLVRLSTLQRINRGADDPAGLIAASQIESELTAMERLDQSLGRTVGALTVADSGMGQVSELLMSIRGNVVEAANGTLSDAQRAAKQMEIDAALDAIDRIGATTSFNGRKLLDPGDEASRTITVPLSTDLTTTATLTLPGVGTSVLGGAAGTLRDLASGGKADLASGNLAQAAAIVGQAQQSVLEGRARAGAFQRYTIESSQAVFADTEINLSGALSQLMDTDVAEETSRLVGSQIAVGAAMGSLMLGYQNRAAVMRLLFNLG